MSGELEFIETLRAFATHPAARGLADDSAVLEVGGTTLLLTHDMLVEGVHYLPDQDMADVAWKLVATNVSDLAAKGARPVGALLGHMLGDGDERFVAGLREALDEYAMPLLGGDTVSAGPPGKGSRAFGLTALGEATHTPVPSRGGAQAGDEVWITGPVGAAMMGFEALQSGTDADTAAYRRPQALLAKGQALAPHVTAMMDVSDGLLLDASRIARASGVTLSLDPLAVPIAVPESRRDDALRWGDDYQLLFTAHPGTALPVPCHRIGEVLPSGTAPILIGGRAPDPQDALGYSHSSRK